MQTLFYYFYLSNNIAILMLSVYYSCYAIL